MVDKPLIRPAVMKRTSEPPTDSPKKSEVLVEGYSRIIGPG